MNELIKTDIRKYYINDFELLEVDTHTQDASLYKFSALIIPPEGDLNKDELFFMLEKAIEKYRKDLYE